METYSRLSGKVAFITGGNSWIGKEIAKLFAREGAHVFISARDDKRIKETIAEIREAGGEANGMVVDISDEKSAIEALKMLKDQYGKIDILIQDAAIYPMIPIEETPLETWDEVINVNLTGSFIILKETLKQMDKEKGGKIVFISSVAGETIGTPNLSHYSASKAGMNGLMRTAALELAKYNITVNSISPGNFINLDRYPVDDATMSEMLQKIPLGRLGKPEDIANLALFLASKESNFITGQSFIIDGGETIK